MGSRESVVVDVLGPFRVRFGGRGVNIPPGRQRTLMAILALSAGRAVAIDRLTDLLWEDDELPDNARRTVQTYITRLRQALGADAITNEPGGYVLRTSPDNVDASRFERLIARSGEEPDVERPLLAEALGLWRGDAFEDLDAERLRATEGRRLAEKWLTATERRIDLDLAEGRAAAVVGEVRELALRHPLREPLWVRLLVTLGKAGRQAEALELYEVVRTRIADELGVDPGPELQRIYASLLDGDSFASARPAPPAPDRTLVPRQLPADIGSFAGRDHDLATLDQLFDDQARTAPMIVAIHGTGGAGKTSLAVHWAHRVAGQFPDGQLYLNLRGYGPTAPMSADVALHGLLSGLGVSRDEMPDDVEARGSLLRTRLAGRRLLILLDNARDSDHVRPLLPGSGPSVVLVTSRTQLRGLVAREGAQRLGIEQLAPVDARELLSRAFAAHEIRHESGDLDELAESCGYLPLALAIAAERASRQPAFGLADLIADLHEEQERLDALDLGDDATTELRAIFAWSYQALDTDSARLFRLLGAHPGPDLTIAAAAAMTGRSAAATRRLLDRLVDVNLLQRRRAGRYELHDLLRSYAAELAATEAAEDRDKAFDRLLEWAVHSTENARRSIYDTPPTIEPDGLGDETTPLEFSSAEQAVVWYDRERRFLVAAIHEAVRRERHRAAYLLVFASYSYLMRIRELSEVRALLPLASTAADAAGDPAAKAQISNFLGMVHAEMGDKEQSVEYLERAVEQFEQAGSRRGLGRAAENLAIMYRAVGRLADATRCHERAMELKRSGEDGDPIGVATGLNNLAMLYIEDDRPAEAVVAARQALDIAERRNIGHDGANYLDTLGRAHAATGDWPAALLAFESSLKSFRAIGAHWDVAATLLELGKAFRATGRSSDAREAWQRAYEILDEIGAADAPDISRTELTELLATVE